MKLEGKFMETAASRRIAVPPQETAIAREDRAAEHPTEQSAPAVKEEQKPHLVFVEGLRALAALVVVFNHFYLELWLERGLPSAPYGFLSYLLIFGHLSVSVFIVISGFCLMLPVLKAGGVLKGGVRRFFQRRFRRILPPYYFSIAFTLFFIFVIFRTPGGSHFDSAMTVRPSDFISHLLLLQNAYGAGRISYVYWSIATEFQIYFLFPLLLIGLRRYGNFAVTLTLLLAGYALCYILRDTRFARMSVQYLGLFALGMAAASVAFSTEPRLQRFRERFPFGWTAALCVGIVAGLAAALGYENALLQYPLYDLPTGVCAACLLVIASIAPRSLVNRVCSWRPLAWLGTFSYSLYLIHVPIVVFLVRYALRPLGMEDVRGFALLALFGLPIIIAVAYGFYLLCERPFMNTRRS